jgi:hypothetical protein
MKQTINNTKLIILAVTVFFTSGFLTHASAGSKPQNLIELKLADSIKGHPVFRLKIANAEENQFYIKVEDAEGTILFNEVLKGKDISRRYLMNLDAPDLNNIRIEITNLKTRETEAYNIKRNTSVVENLVVSRL